MRVEQLWRYPVKSVGGERVEHVTVTEFGFDGDRRWGILDRETGLFLTARREPKLLLATATLTEQGFPQLLLPDGSLATTDDALSNWLGQPVSLEPAGEAEATYESPVGAENEDKWRTWTGPGVALHDEPYARVSILSEQSLGTWDIRRFRSNIVISGGTELDMVGRTVSAGTTLIDIVDLIPRCVMVTRPQPSLSRDLGVLKSINRDFGGRLSAGGLVRQTGQIAVGDAITVSAQSAAEI